MCGVLLNVNYKLVFDYLYTLLQTQEHFERAIVILLHSIIEDKNRGREIIQWKFYLYNM